MGEKRFTDWRKTNFAKRLLARIQTRSMIPLTWEDSPTKKIKPLIDYKGGRGERIWIHPYIAMGYAMSVPEFQAEVNMWFVDLTTLGTINPHFLQWTKEEYQRGLEFNQDDINDLYHQ